ncbi:hypothetical protein MAR_030968 [Mya arenaria]|uniref:Cupin-like domain-containing protein n=1 Tax=Mya arenaria TaxID=6604 RepID=A0ABY7F5B8_MYAAR|nr:hypothetical protein MAR_030968 [Mya arenaria]
MDVSYIVTLYAVIAAVLLTVVSAKTSFVKDLKTDVVFPPVNIQTITGIPEGHLRPLGWQRKPEGKVREEKEPLTAPTFYMRYVKNVRPVVLRSVLKHEPLNMTITVKKEVMNRAPHRTRRRMLLRKFLLDYMYENWYLASTVHEDMRAELPLPEAVSCGTFKERLTEAELWMSSGGTASLLHSHGDHNIHCVLDGRKDFILIDSKHQSVFNFEPTYPNSGSGHSPMDMDMINAYKHSQIAKTPWFAPSQAFESLDCEEEATKGKRRKKERKEKTDQSEATEGEKKKLSLADVPFIWTYSEGERHLSDRALVPSTLRRLLLLLMRDADQLHQDLFRHFYEDAHGHKTDLKPTPDEVFHLMTPNDSRTYLSRDEVKALANSRLQSVCDLLNGAKSRIRDEL